MRRSTPEGVLGPLLDVFRVKQYFEALTAALDVAAAVRQDITFLDVVRRGLLPLPTDRHPVDTHPFPAFRSGALELGGRRLALVATGGSGAMAAIVGVARACEEGGAKLSLISVVSGSALFGFPLGAGLSAETVAEFTLGLRPQDYVDPDWPGLAMILPRLGRGFTGILRGDRLEAAYRELLGDLRLGELVTPTYAPVWNVEHNRLEYLGPITAPDLRVATAVRAAVALPLFYRPVELASGSWCDGGTVDIFSVHPVLDIEPKPDAVLAVNCFYPPAFGGEDATGWLDRPWSIITAAGQVRTSQQAQLARENLARLRSEVADVILLQPVPYERVRGAGFYAQFLDNSNWPEFMRAGRRDGARALRRLARGGASRRDRPSADLRGRSATAGVRRS